MSKQGYLVGWIYDWCVCGEGRGEQVGVNGALAKHTLPEPPACLG